MRIIKSLLVAVGVFLAVNAVTFVVGLVVIMQGQIADPNGITSRPAPDHDAWAAQITGFGVLAGLALGTVAGIVYGVNREGEVKSSMTPNVKETSAEFRKRSGLD